MDNVTKLYADEKDVRHPPCIHGLVGTICTRPREAVRWMSLLIMNKACEDNPLKKGTMPVQHRQTGLDTPQIESPGGPSGKPAKQS